MGDAPAPLPPRTTEHTEALTAGVPEGRGLHSPPPPPPGGLIPVKASEFLSQVGMFSN